MDQHAHYCGLGTPREPRMNPAASRRRAARRCLAAAVGLLASAVLACGGGGGSSEGGGDPDPTLLFGGPGSLDGSFEGDQQQNCDGEDGATSFWPNDPQDCDYFAPDAPDGQQVFRDGPGGGGQAFSWAGVFDPSGDIWTRIHIKLENDNRSFNNLFCLIDEQDRNTFHCLNLHSDGSDPVRVDAGGPSCTFSETRVVGEWCDYLYHASTATGLAELWCDCDGLAAGCGDNLDAEEPDAVCVGNANPGQPFAGFVLYGSDSASAWQIDAIGIHDEDPFPIQ